MAYSWRECGVYVMCVMYVWCTFCMCDVGVYVVLTWLMWCVRCVVCAGCVCVMSDLSVMYV